MAIGTLSQLTTKGIRRDLQERAQESGFPWREHCTLVDSNTDVEPFGWAGAVPQPRLMMGGRRIREIRSFTYNIQNGEYELTVLIPRKWWEDDLTGAIRMRVAEIGSAFANYKPYLFTQMLLNGGTAGYIAYDGATFFHDTRTEGDSGTIDNNRTSVAAADDAVPTAAEFLTQMGVIKAAMARFLDDSGQPANIQAMQRVRVIVPPEAEAQVRTALYAAQLAATDNVFGRGLAELDIDSFLTYSGTTCTIFVSAVGGVFRPIIYQQRIPLEIVLFDDPRWIDANDGLLVTLRERFAFAYGNFRTMVKHVFTT